jgi:hypothetical protein
VGRMGGRTTGSTCRILEAEREVSHDIGLLKGKLKREELKEGLFTYLNSLE